MGTSERRAGGTQKPTSDRAELQRLAQLVELNRERLQTIEQQVIRLDEVRQEQARALLALESIPERSEEHTSELQSRRNLVCRLLLEKKKIQYDVDPPHPSRN